MKEELDPRCVIQRNASLIAGLRDRRREKFKRRDDSPEARAEWSQTCDDFHSQYDALAFPGGYEAGLEKIRAGDSRAIEDALAFIEVRPYFFRSQYMRKKLTRLLNHAPLTPRQSERFQVALASDKKKDRPQHQV